jgi:hypothetical protein
LRETLGGGPGAFATMLAGAGLGFAAGDVLGLAVGAALGLVIGLTSFGRRRR